MKLRKSYRNNYVKSVSGVAVLLAATAALTTIGVRYANASKADLNTSNTIQENIASTLDETQLSKQINDSSVANIPTLSKGEKTNMDANITVNGHEIAMPPASGGNVTQSVPSDDGSNVNVKVSTSGAASSTTGNAAGSSSMKFDVKSSSSTSGGDTTKSKEKQSLNIRIRQR